MIPHEQYNALLPLAEKIILKVFGKKQPLHAQVNLSGDIIKGLVEEVKSEKGLNIIATLLEIQGDEYKLIEKYPY